MMDATCQPLAACTITHETCSFTTPFHTIPKQLTTIPFCSVARGLKASKRGDPLSREKTSHIHPMIGKID